MSIFKTFSKQAPNRVFISILLGALAGIGYSLLIPLLLMSVSIEGNTGLEIASEIKYFFGIEVANYKIALVYLVACLIVLTMRTASEIVLVRVSNDIARDLRKRFYRKIASASLPSIEKIGYSKFLATINIDVPRIIVGGRAIPSVIVNFITLVGMLGFLLYLDSGVFKFVVMAILAGVFLYQFPMIAGRKLLQRSRELNDGLQESTKGLICGIKELKLDSIKRQKYFDSVLHKYEDEIVGQDKKAETLLRGSTSFGDLISFIIIGTVGFVLVNYHSINPAELIGVIMVLLYISSPISMLLSAIPQLAMAAISQGKMNSILARIDEEMIDDELKEIDHWDKVIFDQVEYRYTPDDDEPGFKVGPLSLEIEKGKITFIVGANGSGKSTLSKLITLHYTPAEGSIKFGNSEVNVASIASCRQCISAIYSDYYLFDRLLISLDENTTLLAKKYLDLLYLSDKVRIENGSFSTLALSDGQRKRLALLVAFLEEKSLYLFDEWAADQDPVFKNIFYKEILPDLAQRNKAVVVISHDDRYFDVADKLIVMEQGEIVSRKNKLKESETETGSVALTN